jgi:hypothetical protein
MANQLYVTKDVYVGGTKIEVRQPIFQGHDGVSQLVSQVTSDARKMVAEALRICNPSGFSKNAGHGLTNAAVDADLFQMLFKQWPTHTVLSTVWATLARISAGLNGSFGIKIYTQGSGRTTGYVNRYHPVSRLVKHTGSDGNIRQRLQLSQIKIGKCSRTDSGDVLRTAGFNSAVHSRGEIHISFENLNDPEGAVTLIHEAGHKFANLTDNSYMYNYTYAKAITPADTLVNADTYAWLAFLAPIT